MAKKVDEIADRVGTSSAAVALDWVRQRGAIPILGPRTVGQFEDALKYLSLSLTEEDLNRLTELGEPELSWTYNLLHGKDTIIRQLSAGGMSIRSTTKIGPHSCSDWRRCLSCFAGD